MDFNPFENSANFVELLNSQQKVVFGSAAETVSLSSSEVPEKGGKPRPERKERRTWTPTDDIVLISAWLNTSKDSVVGNEQKSLAFWERVATYFACSPKLAGCERRESGTCKQRWHKLNDQVCKFCGAYEAATREKSSGMNENDVLKLAHEIYFSNYKKRFTLEHAWHELRHDQKWCESFAAKNESSSKKRKCGDGSPSESSQVNENNASSQARPLGVKAAKAHGKKPVDEGKDLSDFTSMWSLKKADLQLKERLSKMRMLESLVAKQTPLTDSDEALKKTLVAELIPSSGYV